MDLAPLDSITRPRCGGATARRCRPTARTPKRARHWSRPGSCCSARIASLSDEGLRRNYLNKTDEHREIVLAWLAHARERKLPRKRREAHLAGKVSLGEPFERLVDTGLRLNEIKTEAELHEFLVDEVTELSGAERVLLVLEAPDAPRASPSPARWCRKARTSARCWNPSRRGCGSAPQSRRAACAMRPTAPRPSTSAAT